MDDEKSVRRRMFFHFNEKVGAAISTWLLHGNFFPTWVLMSLRNEPFVERKCYWTFNMEIMFASQSRLSGFFRRDA